MDEIRVVEAGLVPYALAYAWQQQLHRRRVSHEIPDVALLMEHPHVYTLGRRFAGEHLLVDEALLAARGIEVHQADRGGSITYHGPGQLVGYPIIDLREIPALGPPERPDVIRYLRVLEEALIESVRFFGVTAARREGLTGVWVGASKLAAIGVNVSRGVSKHGFALNVSADLSYFDGMVPCGIQEAKPTSLERVLGQGPAMAEVARKVAVTLAAILDRKLATCSLSEVGLSAADEALPDAKLPDEARMGGLPGVLGCGEVG
ncbi:MAG: lipoyl(octanoyl) transferase LipB [Actinomycetota bacterium]